MCIYHVDVCKQEDCKTEEEKTITLRTKCGGRELEEGGGGGGGEIAPFISSHFLPATTQQSFYGNPSKSGVR